MVKRVGEVLQYSIWCFCVIKNKGRIFVKCGVVIVRINIVFE